MNKNIETLAARCGFRSTPDPYDRNGAFDIPRFAELVVQQCIAEIGRCAVLTESGHSCRNRALGDAIRRLQDHWGLSTESDTNTDTNE